jgi:hypothetical protein
MDIANQTKVDTLKTITIELKERFIKKINDVKVQKETLQEQMDVLNALFQKENRRETDLIDTILELNDIDSSKLENVKLSETGKELIVNIRNV